MHPPDTTVAAIGNFDSRATRDALNNRDEWSEWATANYTCEVYLGTLIHSWNGGEKIHLRSRLTPPHLDQLGRAFPFAVYGDNLFIANRLEDVKLMIDTSLNDYPSLADLPEYVQIVTNLHELGATAIILPPKHIEYFFPSLEYYSSKWEANRWMYSMEFPVTPDDFEDRDFVPGPLLRKFTAFGTGIGTDEKGDYIAIVLIHDNPEDAIENVALLQQRVEIGDSVNLGHAWNKVIYDTVIYSKDDVLLAKLYTTKTHLWISWFKDFDSLLICEKR